MENPIVCALDRSGTLRYNALKQKLPGITNTMLAKRCASLKPTGSFTAGNIPKYRRGWNIRSMKRPLS
jgi:hypothetical protein